jgi:hypothetical protein
MRIDVGIDLAGGVVRRWTKGPAPADSPSSLSLVEWDLRGELLVGYASDADLRGPSPDAILIVKKELRRPASPHVWAGRNSPIEEMTTDLLRWMEAECK